MANDKLIEALFKYADEGWFLFPIKFKDKTPLTDHGFKDATQLQLGIKDYLKKYPGCNWAGYFKGQIIIDVDTKNDGYKSLDELEREFGKFPETRKHRTGSGGLHIIYKQPPGYNIRNTVTMAGYPGIDRRGNGGYIVLPPSIHQCGQPYLALNNSPIIEAPKWLLDIQEQSGAVIQDTGIEAGQPIPIGQQDKWLFSRARSYRGWGDTVEIIFLKLQMDVTRCKPQDFNNPYTDKDLMRIAKSASRYSVNEFDNNPIVDKLLQSSGKL